MGKKGDSGMTNDVIELLNNALEKDPIAIRDLFDKSVRANSSLAISEYVVVDMNDNLRPIGLINGILAKGGHDLVAMVFDDDTGVLLRFQKYVGENK